MLLSTAELIILLFQHNLLEPCAPQYWMLKKHVMHLLLRSYRPQQMWKLLVQQKQLILRPVVRMHLQTCSRFHVLTRSVANSLNQNLFLLTKLFYLFLFSYFFSSNGILDFEIIRCQDLRFINQPLHLQIEFDKEKQPFCFTSQMFWSST